MERANALWNWRLLVTCGLAFMSMWWGTGMAQPVVKVPPGCEVLVTGSGPGTVPGFGGVVGSGGVVAMPDPFDIPGGGGDFKIIPNGTSGHTWSLLGDISLQTAGGIIASGAGPIQNIESFNKNVRPTESAAPSTGTLARSKGQVRIGYTLPPCNASIEFDILKVYPNTGSGNGYVPPIVGPTCWDPNTVVTYSVDAVASDNLGDAMGTDVYYWEVTDGSSPIPPSYTSSDGSSITFTTPSVISGVWTVSCAYGRANPWDGDFIPFGSHSTVESMTIGTPVTVSWTTAPPTCLNTGVTTFTASVSPIAGYNYSWAYVGSGTPSVVGSGAQNSTVTVSGMNDDPGMLVLTLTNTVGACPATQVFQYPVERNFVGLTLTTVPASPTCLTPSSSFTVSLPASAQQNNTTWAMPTGWTFTPSNSQASVITVTVPGGATGGQYTLTASSTACPSGVIALVANVKPVPTFTAGPTCVPAGSTTPVVYTVSVPGPGPFTYSWALPTGWSGSSTTNTITATPNGTIVGTLLCTVCTGTCCTTVSLNIGFNPVTPTIVAPSCYNVGMPGTAVFSIASPVAGTYNWTVAPAFGTPATATGTSISVNTLGNPGTFTNAVSVTHTTSGGCGTSAAATVSPVLTPNGSLAITTGGSFQVLSVVGATGSPTYRWLQNCGVAGEVVCSACGTGSNVLLQNASTGGSWGAYVIAAGCTTRVCTTTTYGYRQGQFGTGDEAEGVDQLGEEVVLSPNPNGGDFELQVGDVHSKGELLIFNSFGQQVYTTRLRAGSNRFEQSQLADGMYFLHIMIDGKVSIKKMEILH